MNAASQEDLKTFKTFAEFYPFYRLREEQAGQLQAAALQLPRRLGDVPRPLARPHQVLTSP
jgi:hypothetical protein